jgi:hypothetical protein
MELSLGDIKNDPERALSIKIEVKKATTVEVVRSMKKMSTMGYEKLDRPSTQSQSQQFVPLRPSNQPGTSQSQSQHPATQEASSMPPPSRKLYQMGNIGQTLEKMLAAEGLGPTGSSNEPTVDAVSSTSRQYYKDVDAPTGPGRREDEEEDDDPKVSQREVRNSETPLVDAYFYGGDRVDSLDVLNSMGMQGMGGNQTGMQIVGFIKKENVSRLSLPIIETVLTVPLDPIRMEDGRRALRLCLVRVHGIATCPFSSPQRDGRAQLGRYRALRPQGNDARGCLSYSRPSNGDPLSSHRERPRVCSLLSCTSISLRSELGLTWFQASFRGGRA